MTNKNTEFIYVNSISELHHLLGLPKPQHPLISLVKLDDLATFNFDGSVNLVPNFYEVTLKQCVHGKIKYGQGYYDFDEGVLALLGPGQVVSTGESPQSKIKGWLLIFHPDFIQNYPLGKRIKEYGFFSYAVNEALHLSEKEEMMLASIMQNIEQEYNVSIDHYSQDVMVSHLELLLNYCNRFYNRQFITRKSVSSDLLVTMDALLDEYFKQEKISQRGLPTVQYVADKLNVSPNYLSDMLRKLTGQNTQQHIHKKLIEQAKEKLSTTNLSISEIAYELGFEHSQSFSKLFKRKTNMTPLKFKQSFN